MAIEMFSHLVEIDKLTKQLTIYRIFEDGRKQLFTQTDLPRKSASNNKTAHEEFAKMIGENILLDSPAAREPIGL